MVLTIAWIYLFQLIWSSQLLERILFLFYEMKDGVDLYIYTYMES